jgi:MFS family permease
MELSKSQFRLLTFICLISSIAEFGLVRSILPFISKSAGATPLQHTAIISIFFVCQVFGLWLRGALSDNWGRKIGLMVALTGSLVGTAMLYSWQTSLLGIFVARVVSGFFNGTSLHAIAIVSDTIKGDEVIRKIGIIESMFWLGAWTFGTALIAVLEPIGLNGILLVSVLASLFNCVIAQVFFKDIPHSVVAATVNEMDWLKSGFKAVVQNKVVAGLMLLAVTYGFGTSVGQGIGMLYYFERFGYDAHKMGAIFAFGGIMMYIASLNILRIIKLFGYAQTMVLGAGLLFCGQFFQGPAFDLLSPSWPLPLLIFGVCCQLIGVSLFITIVVHTCMVEAPTHLKATAYGIVRGLIYCCRGIAPVGGFLYTMVSISAPYYFSSMILIGCIVLTIRFNKRIRSKKTEELPVAEFRQEG